MTPHRNGEYSDLDIMVSGCKTVNKVISSKFDTDSNGENIEIDGLASGCKTINNVISNKAEQIFYP